MMKLGLAVAAAALVGLFAGSAMADKPDPGFKGNGLPLIPMNNAERIILSAHDICPSTLKDNTGGRVIFLEANFGDFDGAGNRQNSPPKRRNVLRLSSSPLPEQT